jgi:uncharacterized protein YacL
MTINLPVMKKTVRTFCRLPFKCEDRRTSKGTFTNTRRMGKRYLLDTNVIIDNRKIA